MGFSDYFDKLKQEKDQHQSYVEEMKRKRLLALQKNKGMEETKMPGYDE